MFVEANEGLEDNILGDLIAEVDVNGDGKIDFSEFREMLLELVGPQT